MARATTDGVLAADRLRLCALAVLATLGCGGATPQRREAVVIDAVAAQLAARFPVVPCANAVRPEAVGVWQTTDREAALIYDGCSVRFVDFLENEMAIFGDRRVIARAFHVSVRDYGEPFPYFRTRARWDGDRLQSVSIIGLRELGRWDGERFVWFFGAPTVTASSVDELGANARDLLLVDRFVPTEEELAAERGVPMPPADDCVPSYVEQMLDPTAGCPEEPGPARGPGSDGATPTTSTSPLGID